ncbi:MAG: DUF87 domain-containing protein [Candidatus Colwellbacteria bacterium]|nr:DUF87 domain-containing protein [Candidatus Colwellbacteria bacterium]
MAENLAGKVQEFVKIKDIKEGIVVLKNGGLRRIVLVDGLNFDLKSEEEQNIITYAYQNFLNSLDFSIQINIHSRKLNVDDYLKKLEERKAGESSELLKTQIGEYLEFVRSFVETNAVMNKTFFVVVPYDPVSIPTKSSLLANIFGGTGKNQASEKSSEISPSHREQLHQRVEQVVTGLRQVGLRAVSLEDPELLELFYNFYNPEAIEKKEIKAGAEGAASKIEDIIAPPSIEVAPNHLKLGNKLAKTLFVFNYPRYLSSGWFSPIINLPELSDVSLFISPVDTGIALRNLRRKSAQLQSQISEAQGKGLVRDPVLETAIQDVESLRDSLQQATEKLFNVGIYMTIYADSEKELGRLESEVVNLLDSKLINIKPANFEQLKALNSVLPVCQDEMGVYSPLNSGPVSSFFPFVSLDLTSEDGILYGINRHNNTLIVFDRFSLENANMVVFAKAGAGKSYATKLEVIRSLMIETDVIIIDPENEYQALAESVGGSIFKISLDSSNHVNPFDIPIIPNDEEPGEVLKSHIVTLTGLVKLMLGKIKPAEEALLDRAITETYASRDIIPGKDFSKTPPPVLEDLETVLRGLDGGKEMAERLYRFTKGSYAGFANMPTNVNIANRLIVFSIRDLEDELRPIAMYGGQLTADLSLLILPYSFC